MAVFALGGVRCVTSTLGCTRGEVRGTGSPARAGRDGAIRAVTDVTDRLVRARVASELSVIAVGVGGPEAAPLTIVSMTLTCQVDATARAG